MRAMTLAEMADAWAPEPERAGASAGEPSAPAPPPVDPLLHPLSLYDKLLITGVFALVAAYVGGVWLCVQWFLGWLFGW